MVLWGMMSKSCVRVCSLQFCDALCFVNRCKENMNVRLWSTSEWNNLQMLICEMAKGYIWCVFNCWHSVGHTLRLKTIKAPVFKQSPPPIIYSCFALYYKVMFLLCTEKRSKEDKVKVLWRTTVIVFVKNRIHVLKRIYVFSFIPERMF